MLILRFPHSFEVWGCWGRSNSIHFAIFRVSGTPKSMISTKSCPGSRILSDPGWEQNLSIQLCTSSRASHCTNHSKIASERCYDVFMLSLHFCFFDFFHSQIIFFVLFHQIIKFSCILWKMMIYHSILPRISSRLWEHFGRKSQKYFFEMKKSKFRKCSDNIN